MLALLTTGVGTAAGQISSTVQFQSSYRAYGYWDDWKWWLPDKCTLTQPIYGSEPSAPGRYPVLPTSTGLSPTGAGTLKAGASPISPRTGASSLRRSPMTAGS